MMTTATHNVHDTTPERVLFMAFALREKTWQLGCTTGHGQKPRERPGAARELARLLQESAPAKKRCGLPETALVISCDEAGRAGFWRHRFLPAHGITNQVVDSSSIAGNRRQRRATSDGLDVRKLVSMLRRYEPGERDVGRVGHGPAVAAEAGRHLHRDWATLKQERASTTTRIKGLLGGQGVRRRSVSTFPAQLDEVRLWDGAPIPEGRRRRLLRVWAHHEFLSQQMAEVEAQRRERLQTSQDASSDTVRQLMGLKGIGLNGAWLWVRAFFAWRDLKNRREVGGLAG